MFSASLEEPLTWANTTLVRDDAVEVVRAMKAHGSGLLSTIGSISLCRSLLRAGLVDRFRVVMFPVITGATTAASNWLSTGPASSSTHRSVPPHDARSPPGAARPPVRARSRADSDREAAAMPKVIAESPTRRSVLYSALAVLFVWSACSGSRSPRPSTATSGAVSSWARTPTGASHPLLAYHPNATSAPRTSHGCACSTATSPAPSLPC